MPSVAVRNNVMSPPLYRAYIQWAAGQGRAEEGGDGGAIGDSDCLALVVCSLLSSLCTIPNK